MDIAGLCLPLKPQKERSLAICFDTIILNGSGVQWMMDSMGI